MKRRPFSFVLAAGIVLLVAQAWADPPVLPGEGFAASHYEALWTKSPFSVSSSEAAPDSPDYTLVAVARFDGVYYASLIDQKSQEHFLVTSDKPARGLTLISVTPGHGDKDTFAMMQKDGQTLTLKMQTSAAAGAAPNTMPGANPPTNVLPAPGTGAPGEAPPPARIRRPLNHLPPRPP